MESVIQHWPFVAFALVAAVVVQVAKATVWTEARAKGKRAVAHLFWWGRKTLPLHPVVLGAAFGLIPGLPASDGVPDTLAAHALYFAAAGLVSTWVFDALKGLAKQRGVELGPPPDDGGRP